jgi:hypothetical protein
MSNPNDKHHKAPVFDATHDTVVADTVPPEAPQPSSQGVTMTAGMLSKRHAFVPGLDDAPLDTAVQCFQLSQSSLSMRNHPRQALASPHRWDSACLGAPGPALLCRCPQDPPTFRAQLVECHRSWCALCAEAGAPSAPRCPRRVERIEASSLWYYQYRLYRKLSQEDGQDNGINSFMGVDTLSFTQAFDGLLKASSVEPVVLPLRSPNLNTHCERFVRSIQEEALEQLVMLGERAVDYVIHRYLAHYHHERNHQDLGNQLITPAADLASHSGRVKRRKRLGGLLSYYYRDAA